MKKLLTIGLALISMAFSPTNAQAFCCGDQCSSGGCCDTSEGVYVGGYAGGVWWYTPIGTSTASPGEVLEFDADWGYYIGGMIGWRWCSGFRVELDVAYREADIDHVIIHDTGGSGLSTEYTTTSEITSITYFANFLHECALCTCGCCLRPFAGFGVGVSTTKLESHSSSFDIDDNDMTFAYQLIMGIAYPINACMDLAAEYRFLNIQEPNFSASGDNFNMKEWMRSHSFVVSFKYVFMGLFPLE